MDILIWLGWAIWAFLGLLWSVIWFLTSGWVSTLLQIAVLVAAIYFLKYGWQRAPAELLRRSTTFARFFWKWLRARDVDGAPREPRATVVRVVRVKEFGDVNVSTLLSLLMLASLALLAVVR
jgi:hypothetical protein